MTSKLQGQAADDEAEGAAFSPGYDLLPPATIPDPICPKNCGACHWCRRKLYGPDYFWREPKPVTPPPAPAPAPRPRRRTR